MTTASGKTQHTAGPWLLDRKNGCISGRGINGTQVATTFFIGSSEAQKAEEQANALLITAAPELLRTVRGLVGILKKYRHDDRICEAAIAEAMQTYAAATGEAP